MIETYMPSPMPESEEADYEQNLNTIENIGVEKQTPLNPQEKGERESEQILRKVSNVAKRSLLFLTMASTIACSPKEFIAPIDEQDNTYPVAVETISPEIEQPSDTEDILKLPTITEIRLEETVLGEELCSLDQETIKEIVEERRGKGEVEEESLTYVEDIEDLYTEESTDQELPRDSEIETITHDVWTKEIKYAEIIDGKVNFEASLFVEKASEDNHNRLYTKNRESALQWNSSEATYNFGSMTISPGDEFSFTQRINFGERIPTTKACCENILHGEGYVMNGEGACLTATVFGESLGISFIDADGEKYPLFVGKEGAIQGHDFEYSNLYKGPGVGINSSKEGQFYIQMNPKLPESIKATIKMGFIDTNPENPLAGEFSPVIYIAFEGIPDKFVALESMRMTAYRGEVLQRVTGRGY